MPRLTRRDFVRGGLAAGAALVLPRSVFGANETVQMGFIGVGGRGGGWAKYYSGQKGVTVAGVVDADKGRAEKIGNLHKAKSYTDLRRLLDDKSVDAVCVATCNHWHALATVWACQAGKDVYVEKPVSWSVWEGRKMVEAARKYNRIVQAGMQQRSCPVQRGIKAFLDKGTLGKIKYVRMNRYGYRGSIGKRTKPLPVPEGIDYNLWLGPAKDVPIYRNKFHYDWHWMWNTGNGEMGNWGPHIIDDCRNAVLRDAIGLPTHCIAGGGRLGYDDAGDTPNTHFVYFGGGDFPLIFDCHGLPRKAGERGGDVYAKRRTRGFLVIECENGYYAGGRGGGAAYDKDGKKIEKISGDGGRGHAPNFLAAVRSRKAEDLNADIEQGHYSSAWCHLGNLSYQVGKKYTKEEALARVKDCKPWAEVLDDLHTHLDANKIDPKKADLKLGAMLEIDPEKETLTGPSATAEAKAIWTGQTRGYRKGFVLPDKV
ncbi:Gfo/Idh/MocA family oxidoreductase [bacterium]|nr:Gfo/Idh/MocA family oxidoreductase [bacterium]